MRIKLVNLTKNSATHLNTDLLSTLANSINAFGDMEVVDTAPDMLHIFGKWSAISANTIAHNQSIGIPVIFTDIDGLADLLTASASHRLCPKAFHCIGPAEAKLINRLTPKAVVTIIANAQFTATTSRPVMLQQFHNLYATVYAQHEAKVVAGINEKVEKLRCKDQTIRAICAKLLYLQYTYKRETIRQHLLDELSHELISSDYDEKVMEQTLDELQIKSFAASAMSLLAENTKLTEGFMPIQASADKTMKRMQKLIIPNS